MYEYLEMAQISETDIYRTHIQDMRNKGARKMLFVIPYSSVVGASYENVCQTQLGNSDL